MYVSFGLFLGILQVCLNRRGILGTNLSCLGTTFSISGVSNKVYKHIYMHTPSQYSYLVHEGYLDASAPKSTYTYVHMYLYT